MVLYRIALGAHRGCVSQEWVWEEFRILFLTSVTRCLDKRAGLRHPDGRRVFFGLICLVWSVWLANKTASRPLVVFSFLKAEFLGFCLSVSGSRAFSD